MQLRGTMAASNSVVRRPGNLLPRSAAAAHARCIGTAHEALQWGCPVNAPPRRHAAAPRARAVRGDGAGGLPGGHAGLRHQRGRRGPRGLRQGHRRRTHQARPGGQHQAPRQGPEERGHGQRRLRPRLLGDVGRALRPALVRQIVGLPDEAHYSALPTAGIDRVAFEAQVDAVLSEMDETERQSKWTALLSEIHYDVLHAPLGQAHPVPDQQRAPLGLRARRAAVRLPAPQGERRRRRLHDRHRGTGRPVGLFASVGRLDPHSYRPNEFFANNWVYEGLTAYGVGGTLEPAPRRRGRRR